MNTSVLNLNPGRLLLSKATERGYPLSYRIIFHLLFLAIFISLPSFILLDVALKSAYKEIMFNHMLSGILLQTPLYLLNVFYYVPRLLKTGRYRTYAYTLLATCLLFLATGSYLSDIFTPLTGLPEGFPLPSRSIAGFILPMLMSLAIGTSFEMILNWETHRRESEHMEQEKMLLEKEKTILELSFLKSQMNPHFLFNALNNIHSLAELKSAQTADAVLMLSDLLRYMLYGTNNGSVPLSKEIECIENYMAIQRLRISKKEAVNIRFEVRGTGSGNLIEPLILLPFVENAFKHGISYKHPSEVKIELEVEKNLLSFRVYNTKRSEMPTQDFGEKNSSGIGLQNIQRRLNLLYPDKHELLINDQKDTFEMYLTIHL